MARNQKQQTQQQPKQKHETKNCRAFNDDVVSWSIISQLNLASRVRLPRFKSQVCLDIPPRDSLSFDVCKWLLMSLSLWHSFGFSALHSRLQHFCSSKPASRHYLKGPCRRPWIGIYYFLLHRWDSCGIYDVRQWLILVSDRCDVKYELRAPELMTAQILIGREFFGNCFRFFRFWFCLWLYASHSRGLDHIPNECALPLAILVSWPFGICFRFHFDPVDTLSGLINFIAFPAKSHQGACQAIALSSLSDLLYKIYMCFQSVWYKLWL